MEDKLENSIMGKIKTGQVRIRSKYIFLAEKLGLGTAFALSVLLSILLFNLILFYLKETDNLKYLSFGKFGLFAFLESFPYLLVAVFIVLIVLSGYLITRSDVSYKKPFGYLAVGLVVFIMLFGGILTYTNLGREFEARAREGVTPAQMLLHPMMDIRENGVAGVVFEMGDNYLILQTPQGLRNIDVKELKDVPELEKGQFVIAVGKKEGYDFKVEKIKVVNKDDLPAIGRGIEFKFKPSGDRENILYFDKKEKDCVKDCFNLNKQAKDCFEECRK